MSLMREGVRMKMILQLILVLLYKTKYAYNNHNPISIVSSSLLDDTTRHLEQQYDEQNMWAVLEKMENVVMYFARVGDCIVLK